MDDSENGKRGKIKSIALSIVQKHREHIFEVIRERETALFKGSGVFCPVCSSEFSSYAPIYNWMVPQEEESSTGFECVKVAETGRCPSCNSLHRQRLLWKFLHERTDVFNGYNKKVLEIAPDLPFFRLFGNMDQISYFPCDLYPEKDKYKPFPGSLIKADICDLQFEDNFFDVILCCHVLEHVENDLSALSEMFRVMKTGGWGIFQSPVYNDLEKTFEDVSIVMPADRQAAFGQSDHVRKYGRDYAKRLALPGFIVNEIDFVNTFSEEEIMVFGLDRYEKIYLCGKKINNN